MGILADKYWDEMFEERERKEKDNSLPFAHIIMLNARDQEFDLSMRLLDGEVGDK